MTYHPTTLNAKKDNSNIHNIINFLKKENFLLS